MMSDIFKLLIDGELVDGDSSMEVIDPATGAPFQTVPRGSARQLDQAVAAATAAQPAWAGLPIWERPGKLLADRKSSVEGTRVFVRVELGGWRFMKKKKK